MGRSPLIYPVGAKPGYNPSHIAAKNSLSPFSFVALNGSYNSLISLTSGTISGSGSNTYPPVLDPNIGLSFNNPIGSTTGVAATVPNIQPGGGSSLTMGAIWVCTGSNSTFGVIFQASGIILGQLNQQPAIRTNGSTHSFSGITFTLNRPYFFGVSYHPSLQVLNVVATDLLTGKIQTGVATGIADGISATAGSISFGSSNSSYSMGGYLSHMMITGAWLPMQELIALAQDPWSFWYPTPSVRRFPSVGTLSGAAHLSASLLPGTVSLTGKSITAKRGLHAPLNKGLVSLTGQSITAKRGLHAPLNKGTLALTGQSITAKRGLHAPLNKGTLALTGKTITAKRGLHISLGKGIVSLTGISADLHWQTLGKINYTATLLPGTVALGGKTITAKRGLHAPLNKGVVALTGKTITAKRALHSTLNKGTVSITGKPATLTKGKHAYLAPATLSLTGSFLGVTINRGAVSTVINPEYLLTAPAMTLVLTAPPTITFLKAP